MKLRNKKTREIIETHLLVVQSVEDQTKRYYINSIKDLCEKYEDYTPAEPLIKDEKVRKAVRAWAEANNYSLVKAAYDMVSEPDYGNVQIHFEFLNVVDEDNFGVHTIAELCGEEEE